MSLPRTSDIAAKQILDSTRVYREYARARRESWQLKGSFFWKKVGPYEYLAQKVKGKVSYIGPRSDATEQKFALFKQKKTLLQQRTRALKESVESCQRMNKAVRAGSVPSPVVEVLQQLEKCGLSEFSIVLGTSALFAYGQPAGVRLEDISSPTNRSLVENARHHLQVLVHAPQSAITAALQGLEEVADTQVEVAPASGTGEHTDFLLEFKFGTKREPSKSGSRDAYWRTMATEMASVIQHAGMFEQVVIGKTGTMATMRTLDPQFFAMLTHAIAQASPGPAQEPEVAECQAALVDSLITEYLVVPKLPEAECRRTVDEIAQRVFPHG